jgi:hypothetical protein
MLWLVGLKYGNMDGDEDPRVHQPVNRIEREKREDKIKRETSGKMVKC